MVAGVRRAQAAGRRCGRPRVEVDLRPAVALLREGRSLREAAEIARIDRNTVTPERSVEIAPAPTFLLAPSAVGISDSGAVAAAAHILVIATAVRRKVVPARSLKRDTPTGLLVIAALALADSAFAVLSTQALCSVGRQPLRAAAFRRVLPVMAGCHQECCSDANSRTDYR